MAKKNGQQDKAKGKFTPVSESAEKKKDTGRPGGGAGRVEEAGGSGVYPASGPWPEGNAPLEGEMSFGQGKRGEAGYFDSGSSEVSFPSGPKGPEGTTTMNSERREIPRDQWVSFFDGFSRQHEGWLVDLLVSGYGQDNRVEARGLPLQGIAVDYKKGDDNTIEIILGKEKQLAVTHAIPDTRSVYLMKNNQGADLGVVMQAGDGASAQLRFRSPTAPGTVDGMSTGKSKQK